MNYCKSLNRETVMNKIWISQKKNVKQQNRFHTHLPLPKTAILNGKNTTYTDIDPNFTLKACNVKENNVTIDELLANIKKQKEKRVRLDGISFGTVNSIKIESHPLLI